LNFAGPIPGNPPTILPEDGLDVESYQG